MVRAPLALLLGTALAFLCIGAAPSPSAAPPDGAAVLERLNQIRLSGVVCPSAGARPAVGPLHSSLLNAEAAFLQSKYMAASGEVSHLGADGSTPVQRASGCTR